MPIPPPSNAERKFNGVLMDLWQWDQKLYDGTTATFECVTRPDAACVIPFLDERTVLLTRQEQPHRPGPFLDVPGGRLDPGETAEAAALRELREETGYRAGKIMQWNQYAQTGLSRFEEFFFVATELTDERAMHTDPGEKIELVPTPWDEVVQMCLKREFRQLNAMLAILAMEFDPEAKRRLHTWLKGA